MFTLYISGTIAPHWSTPATVGESSGREQIPRQSTWTKKPTLLFLQVHLGRSEATSPGGTTQIEVTARAASW